MLTSLIERTQQFTADRTLVCSQTACTVEAGGAFGLGAQLIQSAVTTPAGPRCRYTSLLWLTRTAFSPFEAAVPMWPECERRADTRRLPRRAPSRQVQRETHGSIPYGGTWALVNWR